jgi:hypothetical protein
VLVIVCPLFDHGLDHFDERRLGLAAIQAEVEMQQLPGVDVGERDELGPQAVLTVPALEEWGERPLYPRVVELASAVRDFFQLGYPILLREQP